MRTRLKLHDLRVSLHKQGVAHREFLSDIPYCSLSAEARQTIEEKADKLSHPLMEHAAGNVWRFLDRN